MTDAELVRWLIIGAVGGAVLSLIAFLLSRFVNDVVGRTVLSTVLFAAAGAYFGFAVMAPVSPVWWLIELMQCVAFGTLGLFGWRGSAKWLLLGWALHPVWDLAMHYIGPGRDIGPGFYSIACLTFDWSVAAYILIRYRGASDLTQNPPR
jgi:hypothetical protein